MSGPLPGLERNEAEVCPTEDRNTDLITELSALNTQLPEVKEVNMTLSGSPRPPPCVLRGPQNSAEIQDTEKDAKRCQ